MDNKLRIYDHIVDNTACALYRALLPEKHCKEELAKENIELIVSPILDLRADYDVYIFHRSVRAGYLEEVKALKAKGKKIWLELDDDMWNLPPWNPSNVDSTALKVLDYVLDEVVDKIIVTNQNLADVIRMPQKTYIAPNLIDCNSYPSYAENKNEKLRILWAGSSYHEGDLRQLTEPLKYILEKYDVQVYFFGDIPEGLTTFKRIRNTNLGLMTPDPKYSPNLGFIPQTTIKDFTKILTTIGPNIGLCPLEDNVFNESKSNIKYLEYTMANAVTVASDVGPYKNIKGLITNDWLRSLEVLINNPASQRSIGFAARIDVEENWSWQCPKKEVWMNLYRSGL